MTVQPFLILDTPRASDARGHRALVADHRRTGWSQVKPYYLAPREGQIQHTWSVVQRRPDLDRLDAKESLILAGVGALSEASRRAVVERLKGCLERLRELPPAPFTGSDDLCESHPIVAEWEREILPEIMPLLESAPASAPVVSVPAPVEKPAPRPARRPSFAPALVVIVLLAGGGYYLWLQWRQKDPAPVVKGESPPAAHSTAATPAIEKGPVANLKTLENFCHVGNPQFSSEVWAAALLSEMNPTKPSSDRKDYETVADNHNVEMFLRDLPTTPPPEGLALKRVMADLNIVSNLDGFMKALQKHRPGASPQQLRTLMENWRKAIVTYENTLPASGKVAPEAVPNPSPSANEDKNSATLQQWPEPPPAGIPLPFLTLADCVRWEILEQSLRKQRDSQFPVTLTADWSDNLKAISEVHKTAAGSSFVLFRALRDAIPK